MAVLLRLSNFKNVTFLSNFTFFVPHLFAKSVANFDVPFIFAEWMFWVTLTSYWELGMFFYMLRAWLKTWKFSLRNFAFLLEIFGRELGVGC